MFRICQLHLFMRQKLWLWWKNYVSTHAKYTFYNYKNNQKWKQSCDPATRQTMYVHQRYLFIKHPWEVFKNLATISFIYAALLSILLYSLLHQLIVDIVPANNKSTMMKACNGTWRLTALTKVYTFLCKTLRNVQLMSLVMI